MNMRVPQAMIEEDFKEAVWTSITKFYLDFNEEIAFIEYFKTHWEKKISDSLLLCIGEVVYGFCMFGFCMTFFYVGNVDMWLCASRKVPRSRQDTNGTI